MAQLRELQRWEEEDVESWFAPDLIGRSVPPFSLDLRAAVPNTLLMPNNYSTSDDYDDDSETTPSNDSTSFQTDGSGQLWALNQDYAGDDPDEDDGRSLLVQDANGSYTPLD